MARRHIDPNATIPIAPAFKGPDKMSIATIAISMSLGALAAFVLTRDDAPEEERSIDHVLASIDDTRDYEALRSQMAVSFKEVLTKADTIAEEIAQTQAVALQIPATDVQKPALETNPNVKQQSSLTEKNVETVEAKSAPKSIVQAQVDISEKQVNDKLVEEQPETKAKEVSSHDRLRGALAKVLGDGVSEEQFVVQVAAYPDEQQAKGLAQKISKLGYATRVSPVETAKGILFRVQATDLTKDDADIAKVKLDKAFRAQSMIKKEE